ncbi:MAG: TIGR02680 family protein [Paenibacillaceae bacterium]
MKQRWQLNRAGLFNFWYYDEEEYQFSDGKLLLRGTNGSGKSVTMQSLVTVLLDGKKTADRLDPFGSKARKMEDYLLGEKGISELDERTGYLYLEYKREGTEQYMTTGMGLRAKRQQSLDFWGFAITDNRRIGHHLELYRTEPGLTGGTQKIPLTRRELEVRLEQGGQVVRTQREYMEMVNKLLFGFSSLDSFEELMKLLIQLRSPKLSKDFKPTVIYEILNESLPALTDDELRPLSDTIEIMDQTKSQLDQLLREETSLKRLCRQYDQYNRVIAAEKADGWLRAVKRRDQLLRQTEHIQRQITLGEEQLTTLNSHMQALRREDEALSSERAELEKHDVFQAEQQKADYEKQREEQTIHLIEKEKQYNAKKSKEIELQQKIREAENKQHQLQKMIAERIEEMDTWAEEAAFLNHEVAAEEFQQSEKAFSFSLWKKEALDYERKLDTVLITLRAETQAKERYQEADADLGEARKSLDQARIAEKKTLEVLEEERSAWLSTLHAWHQHNEQLRLRDGQLQDIHQRLLDCPNEYGWASLREPLSAAYDHTRQAIQTEIVRLDHRMEQQSTSITQLKSELEEWKQKKEPEPQRHSLTEDTRKHLQQKGVAFIPFYAAVEFRESVTPGQRERIESAMRQLGLLDALIVPATMERQWSSFGEASSAQQMLRNDRIIRTNPHIMAHTLADYLYPTPVEGIAITAGDIDQVLHSILVGDEGEGSTAIAEDGSYRIGMLQGHAPLEQRSIYIGKQARTQYRLDRISQLEEQLVVLLRELENLNGVKEEWIERQEKLTREYGLFPTIELMQTANERWELAQRQVKWLEHEVEKKNERMKQALDMLQKLRAQVREQSRSITLTANESAYEEARHNMQLYRDHLTQVELQSGEAQATLMQRTNYEFNREEMIEDVDALKVETALLQEQVRLLEARIVLVEQRLKEMGADEIRERIALVVQRLRELPEEKERQTRQIAQLEAEQEQRGRDLQKQAYEQVYAKALYEQWMTVFREENEMQLSFADNVKGDVNDEGNGVGDHKSKGLAEGELLEAARRIVASVGEAGSAASAPDRDKLVERLNQVFYQEQAVLVEYRLTQQTILEASMENVTDMTANTGLSDSEREKMEEHWYIQRDELKSKSRRIQFIMEYNGKRVSPYNVKLQIERDIDLQQQLLNDKDRELYEEIIMNSVGRIIRARIGRAERWVEEMNRLMDERDTSSGLNFSVRWKPLTAEQEDELDTKDLVDLLRADPRLLKESDMNRITSHFRVKIERAKRVLEDKGFGESFHQVIKEMLDYRQWFAFTLYYRREGQQRKELTNNVFYTFSGGEKAMAMYIPLFSAAYSRYSEARTDAPRIISLDEAFAGVDENNVRDMFDLVEKLGFNYIMNSQALWGDYDTVSNLSICELVRPKNAPYVTVIRYHWNGKVRRLIHDAADQNEAWLESAATRE